VTDPIRVLVVEDEPIAAAAHASYVGRVAGFTVAGVASSAAEAGRILAATPVDLLLLDLNLPDVHGLDFVRSLRAAGQLADVMAVTSARDLGMVRSAVSLGVGQYLLKPFTFAAMRDKLQRYAEFRARIAAGPEAAWQGEVDQVLSILRSDSGPGLPKGMHAATLGAVVNAVRGDPAGRSAAEVAAAIGTSRVTARRYLEYLADNTTVQRAPRYGVPGRPEVAYRWSRGR